MKNKITTSRVFKDLSKKLERQLTQMMIAESMDLKAHLYYDILETVCDIIKLIDKEDQ